MTKTFSINNKLYTAKDFTFNLLCDLEETGLSLDDMEKKPMSLIRSYFMFCAGIGKEEAGTEIEEHISKGGKFTDILDVMGEKMNDSGFFRSLNKTTEAGEGETSTKNPKSKKE